MDRANGFINAEDTLRALTAPRQTEMERVDKRTVDQSRGSNRDNNKKRTYETKSKGEQISREKPKQRIHSNLTVETEGEPNSQDERRRDSSHPKYCTYHKTSEHRTEDCFTKKRKLEEMEAQIDQRGNERSGQQVTIVPTLGEAKVLLREIEVPLAGITVPLGGIKIPLGGIKVLLGEARVLPKEI